MPAQFNKPSKMLFKPVGSKGPWRDLGLITKGPCEITSVSRDGIKLDIRNATPEDLKGVIVPNQEDQRP